MASTRAQHHKKKARDVSIRYKQLNLQRSRPATGNLTHLMTEVDMDIAFIQELYVYQNQVTGISHKHRLFASGQGRKRAAIVVANKSIDAILINQLSEEDTVVV